MRFHKKFLRDIGGGSNPVLGSDSAPTLPSELADDNVLTARFKDIDGWPVHRIAVGYKGPGGALTLTANVYIWDELSAAWYLVNPTPVNLVPNRLTFFDMVGLSSPLPDLDSTSATAGALEAYVQIIPAGSDPAGTYTFVVAPDLTTIGV